jgi:uncharacterized tellurite resistance protein B-like protein
MGKRDKPLHFEGAQLVVGAGEQARTYDARFLLASLLVYVAKGDGSISSIESQKMIELLASRLNIRSAEAMESLSSAVMTLADDHDIAQTLRKVSEGLSKGEKLEVFTMMLDVAAVDGKQDPGEIEAINVAARILGMPRAEVHTAYRSYFVTRRA